MYKYLYTAVFADGTTIRQTQQDISSLDPTKSQFYDVLQKEKESDVLQFVLVSDEKTICLNLQTGLLSVNGHEILAYSTYRPANTKPRIIYYRQVQVQAIGVNVGAPQIQSYHIGWQTTTENGENVKQLFAFE